MSVRGHKVKVSPSLKVAIIYGFFSFMWIAFSDHLLLYFFTDPHELSKWQTLKGWGFVLLSSIIIYCLIEWEWKRRRNIESKAQESEERFRSLVELSPDAIMAYRGNKIIFANQQCIKLVGGTHLEQVLGKNPIDFIHPDFRELVINRIIQLRQTGIPLPVVEEKILRFDGNSVDVEVAAAPFSDAGEFAVQVILRDITKQKQAQLMHQHNLELSLQNQQIQLANQLKNEFLAHMSHELRTPLNAVIGFTEFLIDQKAGNLNAKQSEYLQDILNSGMHLLRLINDMLDLAKIEAGKMEFFPEPFIVADTLNEVCMSLAPLLEKRNISLNTKGDMALEIILDVQKFKQILYNLISNAIKFSKTDSLINIRVEKISTEKMTLSIQDFGIGIRTEDLSKLFNEFQQLEAGMTRRFQGTGLGLSLTKKLVELQEGTIAVESEFGLGSTFTITLPLSTLKVT